MIKILSKTAFHTFKKVPSNTAAHKIKQFSKGVWGLSLTIDKEVSLFVKCDMFTISNMLSSLLKCV